MIRLLIIFAIVLNMCCTAACVARDANEASPSDWQLYGYAFGYANGYGDGGEGIADANISAILATQDSVLGSSQQDIFHTHSDTLGKKFALKSNRLETTLHRRSIDPSMIAEAIAGFSAGYQEATECATKDFSDDIASKIARRGSIPKNALNARCRKRTKTAVFKRAALLQLDPARAKRILKESVGL